MQPRFLLHSSHIRISCYTYTLTSFCLLSNAVKHAISCLCRNMMQQCTLQLVATQWVQWHMPLKGIHTSPLGNRHRFFSPMSPPQDFLLQQCLFCNRALSDPHKHRFLARLHLLTAYSCIHPKIAPVPTFVCASFCATTWKCSGRIYIGVAMLVQVISHPRDASLDGTTFLCLFSGSRCLKLTYKIVAGSAFIPEGFCGATWKISHHCRQNCHCADMCALS